MPGAPFLARLLREKWGFSHGIYDFFNSFSITLRSAALIRD